MFRIILFLICLSLGFEDICAEVVKTNSSFKKGPQMIGAATSEASAQQNEAGVLRMDFNSNLNIEGLSRPSTAGGTPRYADDNSVFISPKDSYWAIHGEKLSGKAGTLEMRIKAVDWSGADQSHKYFFYSRNKDSVILLRKDNCGNISFITGKLPGSLDNVTADAIEWHAGEWRTIKAVWSPEKIALYVDGTLKAEKKRNNYNPLLGEKFMLGGVVWAPASGESCIDFLKLSPAADFSTNVSQDKPIDKSVEFIRLPDNIATAEYNAVMLPSSQHRADKSKCAEAALDGNFSTYYLSEEGAKNNWVEVRWPVPVTITGVKLTALNGLVPEQYDFSAFTGDKWVTLATQSKVEKLTEVRPVVTSRVRLSFPDSATGQIGIRELEIAGAAANKSFLKTPQWAGKFLWKDKDKDVWFRRLFSWNASRKIAKAVFMISVDDSYTLYFNGDKIGAGEFPVKSYDLTKLVKNGENMIAVHAQDFGGNFGMLGELILIDDHGGIEKIGSDTLWESLTAPVDNWYKPGNAKCRWEKAAVSSTLPGYEKNITYSFEPSCSGKGFIVSRLEGWPAVVKPGEQFQVTAYMGISDPAKEDYGFRAIIGKKAVSDAADYTLAAIDVMPQPSTAKWVPGKVYPVQFRFSIPDWAPHGKLPLMIRALADNGEMSVRLENPQDLFVKRFETDPIIKSKPSVSEIRYINNQARIVINNEVMPPIVFALNAGYTTYRELGEHSTINAGVYRFSPKDCALYPPDGISEEAHFARILPGLDQQIREVLRFYPNAYLLIPLDCRVNYVNSHPDEATILSNGQKSMHSFSSDLWRRKTIEGGTRIIKHMLESDYAGHVMGILMGTGLGAETMIYGYADNWAGKTTRDQLTLGDLSPAAQKAFREFLKKRYHNDVAELRACWKRPEVTFENAVVEADELRKLEEPCFRDPARGCMAMDYWNFHSDAVAMSASEIARAFKAAGQGKILIGAWGFYSIGIYASMGTRNYGLHQIGPMSLDTVLNTPGIDFLANIQSYWGVSGKTPLISPQPSASMRLHKKLFINEYDIRTFFIDWNVVRDHYTTSQFETINIMRRDFGETTVNGDLAWFCGFAEGFSGRRSIGWYAEDSLIGNLNLFSAIGKRMVSYTNKSAAEVALFINNRDIAAMDVMNAGHIFYNSQLRTIFYELKKIAACTDSYLLSDFSPEVIKQYKVIIFINAALMSDATRKSIREALEKQGKTAIWLYAPGYVDDKAGIGLGNITELTGIKLSKSVEPRTDLAINVSGEGFTVHTMRPCKDPHTPVPVTIGPVFSVTDPDAEILGRYLHNHSPALVRKKTGGMTSYYCGLPFASEQLLRDIFKKSGVYLYTDASVFFLGSDRLLAFHAPAAVGTEINLKSKQWVLNLYTQEIIARGKERFSMKLSPGESALYFLGTEKEVKSYLEMKK